LVASQDKAGELSLLADTRFQGSGMAHGGTNIKYNSDTGTDYEDI
jgi:hypothetical protein